MDTHVTLPWGDWLVLLLDQLAPIVIALAVAGLAWLCRELPAPLAAMLHDNVTAAKIARAVDYAFAKVDGAEKGKTLDVQHVPTLTAWAVEYGEKLFPQIVTQLGDRFRPMILARIFAIAPIAGKVESAPLPVKPMAPAKA